MKKKSKFEWSKLLCGLIVIYGMANGVMYHVEVMMDKMPDSSLAVQCVVTIVGGFLSYLLYQLGLKTSRDKYGIDSEGQPYKFKQEEFEE